MKKETSEVNDSLLVRRAFLPKDSKGGFDSMSSKSLLVGHNRATNSDKSQNALAQHVRNVVSTSVMAKDARTNIGYIRIRQLKSFGSAVLLLLFYWYTVIAST